MCKLILFGQSIDVSSRGLKVLCSLIDVEKTFSRCKWSSLSILLILNADYLVNARRDKTAELILRGVWAPTVPGATDVSLLLHCDQSM